jgi:uncharacterized RDD family membrane protein YckC
MANVIIGTPFNIDLEFRTAPINKRLLSWLIDIVMICGYYYLMLRFIYPVMGMGEAVNTAAELFLITLPVLLYQVAFEMFLNGQTIGKKLMGIKVIDMEGREPTWGQYIIRWLLGLGNLAVYSIPYYLMKNPILLILFLILYLPDFLCMIISAKTQRIGDLAAGTLVIDSRYAADIKETIYLEIAHDSYSPVFAEVMRLTDRDINGIRNLISAKSVSKDTDKYMRQVVTKIKKVLHIESEMDGYEFLEQLLKDYNYYTGKGSTH